MLQGARHVHMAALNAAAKDSGIEIEIHELRKATDLENAQPHALVFPGGESTTIARLVLQYGFLEPLRDFCASGRPVWGTCAGAILLARDVDELDRPGIQAMDIQIQRNAFGRQLQSFQSQVAIDGISDGEFPAVFIRAPAIIDVDASVEILATLPDGKIVAARQRNLLATVFHPELTTDVRLHNLFLSMID